MNGDVICCIILASAIGFFIVATTIGMVYDLFFKKD
jgi:hypothetical protein